MQTTQSFSPFDMLVAAAAGAAVMLLLLQLSTKPSGQAPQVVIRMPDGSIALGAPRGRTLYATPEDVRVSQTFAQANGTCADLNAHGHGDWRVPTKAELNALFENREAVGGFDEAGWYWSSSRHEPSIWTQRFGDGLQSLNDRNARLALRCVRG
jgi:hypothetical protein